MAALLPSGFLAPPGHFNVARCGVVPRPIKTIAAITPALVTSYAQQIELADKVVRYWHKADMRLCAAHVRFRG